MFRKTTIAYSQIVHVVAVQCDVQDQTTLIRAEAAVVTHESGQMSLAQADYNPYC